MSHTHTPLRIEARERILILTLDRPARRNAVDQALADAIHEALEAYEADDRLLAAVLTGAPPCFSAGTDLNADQSPRSRDGSEYGVIRRPRSKPLIAAVEGAALGGGLEILLACDLIVAADDAVFGLPEVTLGVVANCGAIFRAPERLPTSIALQLLLTGAPITAERAHQVGLVNVLTAPGDALAGALELATTIAGNSPVAVASTMRALADARLAAEADQWPRTEAAAARTARAADRAEGIAAFFERRPPRWPSLPD